MKGYSEFAIQTDLVKQLYFHSNSGDSPPPDDQSSKQLKEDSKSKDWRERIDEEIDSHASFTEHFIFYAFYNALGSYLCCCLKRYLHRSPYCKRRMNKANKFYQALHRL